MLTKLLPLWIICFSIVLSLSCCGQNNKQPKDSNKSNNAVVGGACDECDVMFEGMPSSENIRWETTIASPKEPGERMSINGVVYNIDGKTPAKNVILYIYHTNARGLYAPSEDQKLGRRNGHLRGWVKTNENGKFSFESIRPAPYPGRNIPAHIHILVKEPNKTRYYIDEVWFDDDSLITKTMRDRSENRGGSQIIHLAKNKMGTWQGEIKIILGLNIPNYQ